MSKSGLTTEICGKITIASAAARARSRLPGKSSRAIAYAALVARTTAMNVLMTAIPMELRNADVKMLWSKIWV